MKQKQLNFDRIVKKKTFTTFWRQLYSHLCMANNTNDKEIFPHDFSRNSESFASELKIISSYYEMIMRLNPEAKTYRDGTDRILAHDGTCHPLINRVEWHCSVGCINNNTTTLVRQRHGRDTRWRLITNGFL